jgi:AraC family transcriptional regulator of adaptative response / DNA-3-methyladenine glycosylase II
VTSAGPTHDFEGCYRAVCSRDHRFDGWFFTAVTTTGIYCRPSCPAVTPRRRNVRFYATAAGAQAAGFRACRRCSPDAAPGSPQWDARADLVARAMRLIADGVVDREGVAGLAQRLGYGERHLHRLVRAELGTGPLALARAQRAQTARLLIETSALPFARIAFAAGFASVRQFNDTVRSVFAATPTDLRRTAASRAGLRGGPAVGPGRLALRLAYRRPFHAAGVFGFLAARAVPGVEEGDGLGYRRSLRLPHGAGVVELADWAGHDGAGHDGAGHVDCRLRLDDLRDLPTAVQRCRVLLDLDADPVAVDELLGADPLLGGLVRARAGRRVPHGVDGQEVAIRAVLGQQVSLAAARTIAARLAACHGTPLAAPDGGLTRLFPDAGALVDADPDDLPAGRRAALRTLARALADGTIVVDRGADRDAAVAGLRSLPGIGSWTAGYVAMRALGDPDVFPATDLGLRAAARRLGQPVQPDALGRIAARWRPWRSYAAEYLWSTLSPPRRNAA